MNELASFNKAVRWVSSNPSGAVAYVDPSDHTLQGSGGGTLKLYAGKNQTCKDCAMPRSIYERKDMLERILTRRMMCERLYVWDLHHFMMRADMTPKGFKLPKNILDMAFLTAWTGRPKIEFENVFKIYQDISSLAQVGDKLFGELSDTAVRYHDDHWIPMLEAFVKHERRPITVTCEDGKTRHQHVRYIFGQCVTNRVSIKGGAFSCNSDFFNPHVMTKVQRSQIIKAKAGRKIVTADVKSADGRSLACISKDKTMTDFFLRGEDPYMAVVIKAGMSQMQRSMAKGAVLALFNGAGNKLLIEEYDMSLDQAKHMRIAVSEMFPTAWAWADKVSEKLEVIGPTGRIFWVDEPYKARRKLPNNVVQSITADVCNGIFAAYVMTCKPSRCVPLFFVHDEFVFDVAEEHLEDELDHIREVAEVKRLASFGLEDLTISLEIKIGDSYNV